MTQGSPWFEAVSVPHFPAIDRDVSVDVVVVGAGLTGISTAYLFKRAGHRVALIDRGECAGGDTAATTAHLTCVTDLPLRDLSKNFGDDIARAVWEAGYAAIDRIVDTIHKEAINCHFRWVPGYMHCPVDGEPDAGLDGLLEDARIAASLGFDATPIDACPGMGTAAVRFAHQAKFHPLKYLAALLQVIPGDGSYVFEHTAAEKFDERADDTIEVTAGGHRLRCSYVVIATHVPLQGESNVLSAGLLQTKLYPYTTYVLGATVPIGTIPEGLYWDTNDPYRYLRVDRQPKHDLLIFGGEDHKTGQEPDTESRYTRLAEALRRIAPQAEIVRRWSGQIIETNDGLPYIGETEKRQFVATGFNGNGITFGTLGAMMALDAFTGKQNPWANIFMPHRKKVLGGSWDYVRENSDYPYYMVRDRITGAQLDRLDDVARGQGAIVKMDGRKVAAYRSDEGVLSVCSPVCTHLGCIVAWNAAEKTWDCPCHGSRFKATGEVMAGPAEQDLERIDAEGAEHDRERHAGVGTQA